MMTIRMTVLEAALSPTRQMSLLSRMHELVAQKSQFVIATHSPIILAYPDAVIYHLGSDGIKKICFEDTEHYVVTKEFLNNPERMLRILLDTS
jgi:predicted ATPase